jgi:hypothetical protein
MGVIVAYQFDNSRLLFAAEWYDDLIKEDCSLRGVGIPDPQKYTHLVAKWIITLKPKGGVI